MSNETENAMKGNIDGPFKPEDPFKNIEQFRVSQDFAGELGVKKILTTIPVRKPTRQDFIRVHPEESYYLQAATVELKEDRETYLIVPELWSEALGEITAKALYTTINRQGTLFLWPIRLPGEDGRLDEWNKSAHRAAELAKNFWVRVAANRNLGAYELFEATGNLPDPEWPEIEFKEILRIAFRDKIIDQIDHPVLKRLRGEL